MDFKINRGFHSFQKDLAQSSTTLNSTTSASTGPAQSKTGYDMPPFPKE